MTQTFILPKFISGVWTRPPECHLESQNVDLFGNVLEGVTGYVRLIVLDESGPLPSDKGPPEERTDILGEDGRMTCDSEER